MVLTAIVKKSKTSLDLTFLGFIVMESLILAQDERWRNA
jgi:hypothetical protein